MGPTTGTDTAHYHFNFWVKAEDKSDTSALQTAFKCNAGIESIVNVSDKVTYQGGDINTDPTAPHLVRHPIPMVGFK